MDSTYRVAEFYDELGENEWERLDADFLGRLEFEVTVDYLTAHLPEAGRVLDVGGGGGRYAVWLSNRGYDVDLVDVSRQQVSIARQKAREHTVDEHLAVTAGDVRQLPVEGPYDATLCLGGVLSHVLEAGERTTAVQELQRVTNDGGPVFVSVMGLLASVTRMMRGAGTVAPEHDDTELLPDLVARGDYDRELVAKYDRELAMQPMHLFRADEFETLLEQGGLSVRTLAALEGPASQRHNEQDVLTDSHKDTIRQTLQVLREDRNVVDHSAHMLAVCRA